MKEKIVREITALRKAGYSLSEIVKTTGKSKSTIQRYTQNITLDDIAKDRLKRKQYVNRIKSEACWEAADRASRKMLKKFNKHDCLLILVSLYWAEGRKKDFDFINSDPEMIVTFVNCLLTLGVPKDSLCFSVRIFSDLDKDNVLQYWKDKLQIDSQQIISVNILAGKKKGKLQYGMCRVRIKKGGEYFKLIIKLISRIQSLAAAVV